MSTTKDNPKIYVLDGGFSSQISRHVGSTADGNPLWTASFLQTNPEDVMKTHLDFLRAGADIISTNTYQASIPGFVKRLNITECQAYDLIRLAVDLAKEAVKKYTEECFQNGLPFRKPIIAGSIGPYGAYLHDGSEYTGNYADKTPAELMRDWHRPRIDTLVKAGVQLLAIETIPCEEEALVLVNMLKEYPDIKAWITFSCKNSTSLVHGENFKTVARKCWELNSKQLVGVGINCCSPEIVIDVVRNLNDNEENKIPFVTYPNSGEKYNPDMGWIDKDKCKPLASYVDNWLDNNVRYIGGCCRTCAEDIENIYQQVQKWIRSNS